MSTTHVEVHVRIRNIIYEQVHAYPPTEYNSHYCMYAWRQRAETEYNFNLA